MRTLLHYHTHSLPFRTLVLTCVLHVHLLVYKSVGELVVTDVWRKASTRSLQGNEYIISFTDMYLRLSVIYFMKSMKEARDNYKKFEALG